MDACSDRGHDGELIRSTLIRSTLIRARRLATGLSVGLLALLAVSRLFDVSASIAILVAPVALAGIISPVVAYRLYEWRRTLVPADAGLAERCQAFLTATSNAFMVSATVGLGGVAVHVLTGSIEALIGVVTHVIVAGALWPQPERLERFLDVEQPAKEER
jgi:hypothetical protein